eukprot:7375844-Prymnesium_polylepis.1
MASEASGSGAGRPPTPTLIRPPAAAALRDPVAATQAAIHEQLVALLGRDHQQLGLGLGLGS